MLPSGTPQRIQNQLIVGFLVLRLACFKFDKIPANDEILQGCFYDIRKRQPRVTAIDEEIH
jgi:hypothetical protein